VEFDIVDMRMRWWYSELVSVNLDPGLPPRKLYDNLRRLGAINGPEGLMWSGSVVFFTKPSLSTRIDFDVPVSVSANVPEFFFVSVTDDEVCNAVMSIKSNFGVDDVTLSFIKSILPVLLGTLTHVLNHIFTCLEFPVRWCCQLQRLLSP
jgi:hypothetical protein